MSHIYTGRHANLFSGSASKYLLVFVALPLIVIAALGIRVAFDQANSFQQELLKSDLDLIARAIRIPVGEALNNDDEEGLQHVLQSIFSIERVYGTSVFDREGNRIASHGIAEQDLTRSSIPDIIKLTGEKQDAYREVEGRKVFSHFLPVFDSAGQSKGFIQITRRPADFDRPLQRLTWIAWGLWGMLATTICITVLLGYRGSLGRYVKHLVSVMSNVDTDLRNLRARVEGPREIAIIAAGLNDMLDRIADYQQELDRHREEEQALLTRLKDKEKMAAIGNMARGFAHELGAPLSVIDGRARRLERQLDMDDKALNDNSLNEKARYELAEIHRQVNYLTQAVKHLLEFSRPASPTYQKVSLTALIQRVVEIHRPAEGNSSVSLEVEIAADLPLVQGDPERLQIALSCLVRNALQAARTAVHVQAYAATSNELHILIRDDGDGLPDIELAALFEPFYTTKPSGQGTGLGLSIANGVALDHGGTLHLSNHAQGGCEARFTLPAAAADTDKGLHHER